MRVAPENYIRQAGIIFFANKKIISIVTFLFIFFAFVVLLFFQPVYSLTGTIIVKARKLAPPPEVTQESQQTLRVIPASTEDILTEIELIRDKNNIKNTVKDLLEKKIALQPEPSGLPALLKKMKAPLTKLLTGGQDKAGGSLQSKIEDLADMIGNNLSVFNVPGSNMIKVNLAYSDPDIGHTILNAVLDHYLDFRLGIYTNQSAGHLFAKQKKEYEAKLASLYQKKLTLLDKYGLTNIDNEMNTQMQLIERTTQSIDALRSELEIKFDEFQLISTTYDNYMQNPNRMFFPFPYDFDNNEINSYNELHNTLLKTYTDLKRNYNEHSPQVASTKAQLKDVWEKLMFLIKSRIQIQNDELASRKSRLSQEEKKLADLRKQNNLLNDVKIEITRIDQEINLNNNNYEAFYHKIEELNIEQADTVSQFSNVQIVGDIGVPRQPVFPQKTLILAIAVFVGLFFGISAGFIKEFFDHTFKTPEHVKEYLDLPVIGSIQKM